MKEECRLKYIDDQTHAEVIDLKKSLLMTAKINGPREFHDRHGHILPPENSKLQNRLNDIGQYAEIHQLKINEKKTKVMAFNFTKKFDFQPKMKLNEKELDVIYKTKLLGIMITSDCKWNENTDYIKKKARTRIWIIRRLKSLGASTQTLLDIYRLVIRSVI